MEPGQQAVAFEASDSRYGQPGDIVQLDAATGRASVLISAAKLNQLDPGEMNEKDRDHRNRYDMPSLLWASDSKHVLLDRAGRLWLYDIAAGTGRLVVDTGSASGDDPKFSPDGQSVSYLHNHNLYVHPVASDGRETALTTDTAPTLLNGEVDWVYLEELDVRSNYFWSPDSAAIAYLQMDEAKVPEYPITDFIPTHAVIDSQRYPQLVTRILQFGWVWSRRRADPPASSTFRFSPNNDYIPRLGWVDAHTVFVEVLKRDQKTRTLYFADVRTGETRAMYTDTDDKYLNFDYDVTMLPRAGWSRAVGGMDLPTCTCTSSTRRSRSPARRRWFAG